MFLIPVDDDQVYGIKPMNCPGHMLLFGSQVRSYRELPIRYAEAAPLHRNELAGALHGLTRVRFVTQDDAHIFCTEEQVPAEIDGAIEFVDYLYGLFGMVPRATLSTRPDNRLGDDAQWDRAEDALRVALERHGMAYEVDAGGGAFYGPKIDLFLDDVLGRAWQTGTIQYDMQMPAPLRAHLHGCRQPRAHADRDPPRALTARSSASSGSWSSTTAAPSRSGSRPFRCGCWRSASSTVTVRTRSRRGSGRPDSASTSTIVTRRSASGSATASSRRSRSSSCSASASRRQRSRCARAVRASRRGRSCELLADLAATPSAAVSRIAPRRCPVPCYAWRLQSRGRYPHLRSQRLRGFNRVERRGKRCRCLPAAFLYFR